MHFIVADAAKYVHVPTMLKGAMRAACHRALALGGACAKLPVTGPQYLLGRSAACADLLSTEARVRPAHAAMETQAC